MKFSPEGFYESDQACVGDGSGPLGIIEPGPSDSFAVSWTAYDMSPGYHPDVRLSS